MSTYDRDKWAEACKESLDELLVDRLIYSDWVSHFLVWLEEDCKKTPCTDLLLAVSRWTETDTLGKEWYKRELEKVIEYGI